MPTAVRQEEVEEEVEVVEEEKPWSTEGGSKPRAVAKHDLLVRLTDDVDPCFLYSLHISEEDFQSIKVQQRIRLEFTSFPDMLIEYFNECRSEQKSSHPRFQLLLSSDSASLQGPAKFCVIERCSYQDTNRLTLRLKPGSDREVNEYLAASLTSLKGYYVIDTLMNDEKKYRHEVETLVVKLHNTDVELKKQQKILQETQAKLEQTEKDLHETQQQLSSKDQQTLSEKTKELDEQHLESRLQTKLLSNLHSERLESEKEKVAEIQSRLEKQELSHKLESDRQQFQTRLAELEKPCQDLTQGRYKDGSAIDELKCKLTGAKQHCRHFKQQVESLEKEIHSLHTTLHEKERLANQLQMRVGVLEQQVVHTSEALEATKQQKVEKLQKQLNEDKDLLKTKENVISCLHRQLNEKPIAEMPHLPEPLESASALSSAGLRTQFDPQTSKAASSDLGAVPKHTQSAGLDPKYFRLSDSIPVYGLPASLPPRESPPERNTAPVPSSYFPS
ncbi:spindle assembly abnormal protein 6 homolog [Entelurus aequoreus]|uniref:spindle assembly abnormal protein 6 homolog n=1 Tax=Entelurus aequoreus TaxID=161455 RepID=UPI002B1D06C0|nr:spindle assembly abnormal protein 6 homolog [Entelurus aequoreus]